MQLCPDKNVHVNKKLQIHFQVPDTEISQNFNMWPNMAKGSISQPLHVTDLQTIIHTTE